MDQMVDTNGKGHVDVVIEDNKLWVNIDGVCALRSYNHANFVLQDNRTKGLLLSDEERGRFIHWLRNEIVTDGMLAGQMDDQSVIAKKRRVEKMAKEVVLRILESIHRG